MPCLEIKQRQRAALLSSDLRWDDALKLDTLTLVPI